VGKKIQVKTAKDKGGMDSSGNISIQDNTLAGSSENTMGMLSDKSSYSKVSNDILYNLTYEINQMKSECQ